jgi:membrane-associated protease RseP (regulator of RpoE activity)
LISQNLGSGMPFAVSLLAILLAHEFGHYLAARYHKTDVTLPYFLPFPFSPFGTLGAFIQLKEPPRNKRILLDIGIAGPLAGLIVAIPVLLIGLSLSEVSRIPGILGAGQAFSLEGNSILYLLAKFFIHGQWLPTPASYGDVSPIIYWLRYVFTGLPSPIGGMDVMLHPIAWAGWAGLLVTALNLIPAGQLDGGHVLYALFGKNSRFVLPFILGGLAILGFFWQGWWLWVFLILFLGSSHAQPLDQITKLDTGRVALAVFGLIVFVLVFVPVPLQIIQGAAISLIP